MRKQINAIIEGCKSINESGVGTNTLIKLCSDMNNVNNILSDIRGRYNSISFNAIGYPRNMYLISYRRYDLSNPGVIINKKGEVEVDWDFKIVESEIWSEPVEDSYGSVVSSEKSFKKSFSTQYLYKIVSGGDNREVISDSLTELHNIFDKKIDLIWEECEMCLKNPQYGDKNVGAKLLLDTYKNKKVYSDYVYSELSKIGV